mmetsp:Transcript_90897/g.236823  ORF Transcript_90897/g.236823 Transcript_90897/m.236823 type:complete len:244 (-) Transcript_90897:88-819(-)
MPWITRVAEHRISSSTHGFCPLKMAWCSAVHPSVSWRSGSAFAFISTGMRSTCPLRAAIWSAARPFALRTFMFTLVAPLPKPEAVRTVLSITSRQSRLPQNTAAVRAVQPFSCLWLTLAFRLRMSRTSCGEHEETSATSLLLAANLSACSASLAPGPPRCSGMSNILRTSRSRTFAALKAAHSMSLLWSDGSAPCCRSFNMNSSSDAALSAAYRSMCDPVESWKFGSALASKNASAFSCNCGL